MQDDGEPTTSANVELLVDQVLESFDAQATSSDVNPPALRRLIVEIGTGRGENIVAAALREPGSDFLGVEVYGPGLARAMVQAEAARPGGLPNLKLIQADAPELLAALPEHIVDELWVFFSDPWPKARHQKRRLISLEFARAAARILKPGGIIRLATDWDHYAEQMREVFAQASSIGFEPVHPEPQPRFEGRVVTAFEARGIREGRQITDFAFRLRAVPSVEE
jgi:tRNA (guanine-N7-)-methyltransferase